MSRPKSMSCPCDLFFIFILITINDIISLKQRHLPLCHSLEYALLLLVDNVDEQSK